MKTRAFAQFCGYLLATDQDEYLSVARISPHSMLIGWVLDPELAKRFETAADAAVLAIALKRFDLELVILLETASQWLVEPIAYHEEFRKTSVFPQDERR